MGLWKRVRKLMEKPEPVKPEKTPMSLQPGDVCEVSLMTYEIIGRTEWKARSTIWLTLRDGSRVQYLQVEKREQWNYNLYEAIDGRLDAVDEVPSEIELDGTWYYMEDQYNGLVQVQGQTPFGVPGEQYVWEYQSDNRKRLRIEWQDGRFQLYEGESVLPADVRVIRQS
ncbi:DUF4178 domain-containing protein [Paenibacillus sp. ACRRX]|uniref:DUF4178 domain-containing protein n=1 Tax=unclassified Paenibacillus TaxID=185978 RepID=UPI001EF53DC4|nr:MULTISPECIES: DUF4178 domain-containing protein [unclassified Paenibacillus]MCG7409336.1 DUF4178 domain-containing protein [Paenibacillus sp. ACRRX]MDK8179994.1 DUF4178 domain-containing protein [Paenibacillus sp. UMB4589-SE434]